jgi:MFS family permease
VTSVSAFGRDTFSSLRNPNYRKYYTGQAISMVGTWMQLVAQSWLVLQVTGSGTAVGLVVALQTLPNLLLGPYGGVIADRVDKRKLMIGLQSMMGLLALVLGVLTLTHTVRIWEVFALAFLLGLNNTFENPARQTFVLEMVGPAELRNAVSLNSVLVNAARAVGPAFAGVIIAAGGTGLCFVINAVSFVAVVTSLVRLDVSKLQRSAPTVRAKGQVREGLRYVRRTPTLAITLMMMAVIGCLAYEFQVVLPVVARETFKGGAEDFGFMTAAMGVGAVAGGLYVAARGKTGVAAIVRSATLFGIAILAAGLAPYLWSELVALLFVGATSVSVMAKGNSTLQLEAAPGMRGRVMSLWAVAFLGSTPIGGPIAGFVSEQFGGRAGLFLGAGACLAAAAYGSLALRRVHREPLGRPALAGDEAAAAA